MAQALHNTARSRRGIRFGSALAVVALWCAGLALAADAQAQSAAAGKDPSIVVARTVNPRIAYRGVPKEDMPAAAEVTTFPQAEFQAQLKNVTTVGDLTLGLTQAGDNGVQSAIGSVLTGPNAPLSQALGLQGSGGSAVPRGMGASTVGGSVQSATAGISNTVNGALGGALGGAVGSP